MFNNKQKEILKRSNIKLKKLNEERVFEIAKDASNPDILNTSELIEFLQVANALYRSGDRIVSDADYDFIFLAELKRREPNHPFLQAVEPESGFAGKTVELPVRMLSTDKTYDNEGINNWINRIIKAAADIGKDFETLQFRLTPKLDGFAAYDDGKGFYTRGDGKRGTDITRVFDRGLMVAGRGLRGLGAGEIVVSKKYFSENLSPYFENTRNFQASVVKEKELEEHAAKAIKDKAAVFFPFTELPCWTGSHKELMGDYDRIVDEIWSSVDYDIDGVIFEITDDDLKKYMGATNHHHRWQIALKSNDESAEVMVESVIAQTSRNGKITPVAQFEPTRLSGAEISRATAHNYGMVREKGIGKGAVIRLVRSGLVIPKIDEVIESVSPEYPENMECPSCHQKLEWVDDNLFCLNTDNCKDQIEKTIIHFFDTLGNNDGLGAATISILNENGVSSIYEVYQLENNAEKLAEIGYKEKTVKNLIQALSNSRKIKIEDWRFLAAFGINRLGLGVAEKLLQHHRLEAIFDLTIDDFVQIDGFAEITARQVFEGLKEIRGQFNKIYDLGFNLERTPLITELKESGELSPVAGKQIVFTGSMVHGKRAEMQAEAKKLGAKVGSSVTGKTDYLVTGEKVGVTKISAAEAKGVEVLSEDEYLALIKKK
ncbi:MAG: DNA ligase [Gammaproteobacteria bacterium]|nr:DNA ligase [Gammaproteobacteria bacterium]